MSEKTGKNKREKNGKGDRREPGTSTIEWIVAGVGCLLLLAVIAYLLTDALSGRNGGTTSIVVETVRIEAGAGGYVVEFSASNRGGKSVAGVEITGELRQDGEVVEERSVTLDYVPQHSERIGALIFRNDPQAHELRIFATGYITP